LKDSKGGKYQWICSRFEMKKMRTEKAESVELKANLTPNLSFISSISFQNHPISYVVLTFSSLQNSRINELNVKLSGEQVA
jgi:hypothetical protein